MAATNLVEVCKQFLTPDTIGAMSSSLHLDPHAVENAAEGAVPALLASMGAAVGRPGGDRQLADAMAQVPQGSVDDMIYSAAQRGGFGTNGSNPLSGLLSSRTQDSLAHAVGQYAHIGDGDSKKLLGMLGPAVLGMLGRQRMASGLDAIGLADLLSSQRRKIADAIPQGLADQMSASGLGDALRDRPRVAASSTTTAGAGPAGAAQRVTRTATSTTTHTTTPRPTPRRQSNAWLWWLLGLAALAAIAFYSIGNRANRAVRAPAPATQQAPHATTTPPVATAPATADSLVVGGVNLGDEVTTSLNDVRSTMSRITDEASAQAALPALRDATAKLDNISTLSRQLSPGAHQQLAQSVNSAMPAVQRDFDRVLAIPGVSPIVQPVVDGLRTRITSLGSS
jgi:hypothetical protein